MRNLCIELENHPGALAEMGEVLGRLGISIEGGGAFVANGKGLANFLFEDGTAARDALDSIGIRILLESDVVVQRLDQDKPGQLGKLLRRMAEAGVNVEAQYSDHQHQLVLVVDEIDRARSVSAAWMEEHAATQRSRGTAQENSGKHHRYAVQIAWTGNTGLGTANYASYRRDHTITGWGKPSIDASSDPAFRGNKQRYNPEELLVATLSSCHMLWYLHLCAVNRIIVQNYEDTASGTMVENADGSGRFVQVDLHPAVTIDGGSDPVHAQALHSEAHRHCFIANSVNFPVRIAAKIICCADSDSQ